MVKLKSSPAAVFEVKSRVSEQEGLHATCSWTMEVVCAAKARKRCCSLRNYFRPDADISFSSAGMWLTRPWRYRALIIDQLDQTHSLTLPTKVGLRRYTKPRFSDGDFDF